MTISLNKEQIEKVSEHITKINFFKKIKNKLDSSGLIFPQLKNDIEYDFCNEEAYGKVNMLCVSGLLTMN